MLRACFAFFILSLFGFSVAVAAGPAFLNNKAESEQTHVIDQEVRARGQADLSPLRVPLGALVFGGADFEWFQQVGDATANHIWVIGDYWAQTFYNTPYSSIKEIVLTMFIDENTLTYETLNLDVLVNNIKVGAIAVPPGVSGRLTYSFSFSSIPGPDLRVQLIATNTISPGGGSVSMATGGSSYVVVPRPRWF